ncbi:unnamed protein product [Miscanthus lutarioriparius]|uniref:Peptidase A1 domain-containing protein n=1 Tax=Miscanthus lutarioriparius TaxID=422564 RepID=A0A811Q0Z4_9POAL|nr:unnamed protein product [Miscanthus lutarioriparius]
MAQLAVWSLLLSLLLVSPVVAASVVPAIQHRRGRHRLQRQAAEEALDEQMQSASPSPLLKLRMDHRTAEGGRTRKESLLDLAEKDAVCIETMHRRAARFSGGRMPAYSSPRRALSERMVATVESGVAVGSGEYLMDIYVGTPPRRFRMIMDTGSDLNWLQCAPCLDCFEQRGPVFDPATSSSYRNVTCPGSHSSKHTAPPALAAIGGTSASPHPPPRC